MTLLVHSGSIISEGKGEIEGEGEERGGGGAEVERGRMEIDA